MEYDSNKIRIAIQKANAQVTDEKRVSQKQITGIIEYIESLNKKRMLVEDIQDIIEEKLMNYKKYDLAKVYIIYRYTRALVRKSNFTDETILEIIKNTNRNYWDKKDNLVMTKRNLIASLVSKNLTSRILLPEKIAFAHDKGYIFFNDMENFIQPSINSSHIALDDMLDNGTTINDNYVKPKNFIDACLITTEIAFEVANGQHGEIFIELKHLLKYLKTKDDIGLGAMILQRQFNNMVTIYGETIRLNLMIEIVEAKDKYFDFYEQILKTKWQDSIKLVYMISDNSFNSVIENYIKKGQSIKIIANSSMINCYKFDQGMVSLNLADIAEDTANGLLDDRLELCHEALMFKHHSLIGTPSTSSPIHYLYGSVARINDEKIDRLLKNKLSTLTLGYSGLRELITLMGVDESLKIIDHIKKKLKKWSDIENIEFRLQPVFEADVCCYFSVSKTNGSAIECFNNYINIDDIYRRVELENRAGIISKIKICDVNIVEFLKYIQSNKLNIEFII